MERDERRDDGPVTKVSAPYESLTGSHDSVHTNETPNASIAGQASEITWKAISQAARSPRTDADDRDSLEDGVARPDPRRPSSAPGAAGS